MSQPTTEPTTPVVPPVMPAMTEPPKAAEPDGADALGDPGKRALDAMKAERNAAKAEAAAVKAEFDALQAKIAGKEAEHAAQVAAQQMQDKARADADAAANLRILKAEVRAASTGKLADPADALKYLDLSTFEVKEDGSTDEAAIAKAVEDLITSKPYLAAATAPRWPGIDAGARNGTPPNIAQQIQAAQAAGNYELAISLTNTQIPRKD